MTQWRVQLQGEQFDLQELKEILLDNDPCIIEEDSNFYLTSKAWDKLGESREVNAQAKAHIQDLENAAYLHHKDTASLGIGSIIRIDDDGKKHHFLIAETGRFTFRVGRVRFKGIARGQAKTVQSRPEHPVIKILRKSKNPLVKDALRFYRKGDWVNLYKAYEIVNDAVHGKHEMVRRGWVSKESINSFTQTAQSRKALGDDARHASVKFNPPKTPMTINEAKTIIGTLLQRWLESL
jgi:hypothetical protein